MTPIRTNATVNLEKFSERLRRQGASGGLRRVPATREGSPSRRLSVLLGGKVSAVRWNIAANIVILIVTLQASSFVAAVCYGPLRRVAE